MPCGPKPTPFALQSLEFHANVPTFIKRYQIVRKRSDVGSKPPTVESYVSRPSGEDLIGGIVDGNYDATMVKDI